MTKRKAEDNEILIKSTPNTCTIVTMKLPQALGNKNLDPFFGVSKDGPMSHSHREGRDDRSLVQLELACEAYSATTPDPVYLATTAIAEAILMRIFVAVQIVPSLHRVAPRYLRQAARLL